MAYRKTNDTDLDVVNLLKKLHKSNKFLYLRLNEDDNEDNFIYSNGNLAAMIKQMPE